MAGPEMVGVVAVGTFLNAWVQIYSNRTMKASVMTPWTLTTTLSIRMNFEFMDRESIAQTLTDDMSNAVTRVRDPLQPNATLQVVVCQFLLDYYLCLIQ